MKLLRKKAEFNAWIQFLNQIAYKIEEKYLLNKIKFLVQMSKKKNNI